MNFVRDRIPHRLPLSRLLPVIVIAAMAFPLLALPGTANRAAARVQRLAPPAGVIAGLVWNDVDLDLFPDPGEPPLAAVLITLRDSNQVFLTSTTTAADGTYRFEGLNPNVYWVEETDPPGYLSTTANQVRVQLIGNEGAEVNFGDARPATETPTPSVSPLTVQRTVQRSLDDTTVRTDLTANAVTASTLHLGRGTTYNFYAGVRFDQLNIPHGAQILDVRLRLFPSGSHNGTLPVNLVIVAEASDAALDFADANPLLPNRPRTQAAVDWQVAAWPTDWFESPNLAGPLQEVIDRSGWAAGRPLALFLLSLASNTGTFDVAAWDGNPALAAQLSVTFRPPAGWATATPTATRTATPTPTPTATPVSQTLKRYFPLMRR